MIKEVVSEIQEQLDNYLNIFNELNKFKEELNTLRDKVNDLNECWSNSWIGFHANLYFKNFQKLPSWQYQFDSEWGSVNGIPEYWVEKSYCEIEAYIKYSAPNISYNEIKLYIDKALKGIKDIHEAVTINLVILKNKKNFEDEWKLVEEISNHKWGINKQDIINYRRPKQMMSRDSFAMQQGMKIPPHIEYDSSIVELLSQITSIEEFIKKCNKILKLINIKSSITEVNLEIKLVDIQDVLKITTRFHQVARQLRSRYSGRNTIEIEDEYDVQDLFHGLLKMYFEDIRSEEWNPSYAGAATRSDFLLKKEKIVIEVKKTRASMSDKTLGEQLIIDIAKYRQHPDCKTLICFVYDPEGRIGNPTGIEEDLNKMSSEELNVIVRVEPK